MSTADLVPVARAIATAIVPGASPSPTPVDPTVATVNVALSNYYLAVGLLITAVAVIVIALVFAYLYHAKLLAVVKAAVKVNNQAVTAVSEDVTRTLGTEAAIAGPDTGAEAAQLVFAIQRLPAGSTVSWTATGGDPSSAQGESFVTAFAKAGDFEVSATYTDPSGTTATLTRSVKIGAQAPAPAPAAPSIALPFVIKNWGRLVIIIFGVGVISALMATKILDAAAGIGILGTLLGVGAVTATSGASTEKPSQSDE